LHTICTLAAYGRAGWPPRPFPHVSDRRRPCDGAL